MDIKIALQTTKQFQMLKEVFDEKRKRWYNVDEYYYIENVARLLWVTPDKIDWIDAFMELIWTYPRWQKLTSNK